MTDLWHLHKVDWLRQLAAEEVQRLREAGSQRDYAAGEMVFSPEVHPQSVYLLEWGLARIYRLSTEGSETTFGYVGPGEVFGELTAFGDYPRESFAQAARPSRIWRIPSETFRGVIDARPGLVLQVARQIGDRFKRIESRVEDLVFRDVRARVAHMLLQLASDFGEEEGDGMALEIDITQAELATLVGATRQSVNACLRELEEAGLLEKRGRHLFLAKLRELGRASEPAAATRKTA